jgi:hypothetical protein
VKRDVHHDRLARCRHDSFGAAFGSIIEVDQDLHAPTCPSRGAEEGSVRRRSHAHSVEARSLRQIVSNRPDRFGFEAD